MTLKQALGRDASRLVIVAALGSLALSGCHPASQQQAAVSSAPAPLSAIPLATSGAPPIAPAPVAGALPPAPAANVGRLADPGDRYAFAERAYAMTSAFGDAPPDYTFDYGDGQRPWVWRGDDQSMRVAEALPDGGYRYYYYEAGARTPYLVRDPDYSYGYDNGVLVVVYDRRGHAAPPDELNRQAAVAGRFLARAQAIYAASQQDRREAVAEANWAARRSAIDNERAQWAADQASDQDWRAYHAEHAQEEDAQWDAERYRREAQAARFAEAINDTALAAQDWRAAQHAQTRAAVVAPSAGPQGAGRPAVVEHGPPPPAAPVSLPVRSPPSSQPPLNPVGPPGAHEHRPPPPTPSSAPLVQPVVGPPVAHEHRPPPTPSSAQPVQPVVGPPSQPKSVRNPATEAGALRHGHEHAGGPPPGGPASGAPAASDARHSADLAAQAADHDHAVARQAQLDAQHKADLAALAAAHPHAPPAGAAVHQKVDVRPPSPPSSSAAPAPPVAHHHDQAKVTPPPPQSSAPPAPKHQAHPHGAESGDHPASPDNK